MSTALLSTSRFANLKASLVTHATSSLTRASASQLNGELCRAFGVNPFQEDARATVTETIATLVFDWQRVNYNAHVARYSDEPAPKAPSARYGRGTVLNPPATLKALQALRYNCDNGDAIGESLRTSLEKLNTVIDTLTHYCIDQHCPEYAAAEWAI